MASAIPSRKRMADSSGFVQKWGIVEETVRCIFKKEVSKNSFQRIHHSVFQLCQRQFGNLVLEQLEEQFRVQVVTILERISGSHNFAADFLREWQDYNDSVSQISNILLYFDKNYMYAYHHSSIEQAGERVFCSYTLGNAGVSAALVASIKQSVDVPAAESTIRDLGQELYTAEGSKFFTRCMEIPFVEAKVEKYLELGEEQKQVLKPGEYLQWVQSVVSNERDKYADTFFYILLDKLTNALYTALVLGNSTYVQNVLLGPNGLEYMTTSWDIDSISTIVKVFCAMKKEKDVTDVIARVMKERAEEIVTSKSANTFPFTAVESLLQLISKARELDGLFPSDEGHSQSPFLRVVRNVLGGHNQFMETLSLYYDNAIRQGKDDAMEAVGNNVLNVLQLTPDLEPFEVSFRGHLAARLIHAKPHAVDTECRFIDRLFTIYGTNVANRFQKMVEDIRSATAAQEKLVTEMAAKRKALPLEFDVLVLTSGLWPQYASTPLVVPQSMETCKHIFHEHYRRRHNGRKLVFQMSLGSVVFQLCHGGKAYAVSAHTHFVNSILALNADDDVSVTAVARQSALVRDEVLAQFNTLCLVGLAEGSGDTFRFNKSFYSAKPKVKVSASSQRASGSGGGAMVATRKAMEGTRTMSLDATIIKVLKTVKYAKAEVLCNYVQEVLENVYVPLLSEVKQRVEVLIEKGFIVRGGTVHTHFYFYNA